MGWSRGGFRVRYHVIYSTYSDSVYVVRILLIVITHGISVELISVVNQLGILLNIGQGFILEPNHVGTVGFRAV